jgi:hypothetical protein
MKDFAEKQTAEHVRMSIEKSYVVETKEVIKVMRINKDMSSKSCITIDYSTTILACMQVYY